MGLCETVGGVMTITPTAVAAPGLLLGDVG
jgi:hypothetical protein